MSGLGQTSPTTSAELIRQVRPAMIGIAAALDHALELEQAARNLLATLTPEGDVERLAAKKLAELLGPEVAEHG